jgi:diaminopimelate decarboxylase
MSAASSSSTAAKKKVCPLSTAELEAVSAAFGTPVQLYDEASIRGQIARLYAAFHTHGFADFRNFFAVKALPNPAVLAVVRAAGCGFDCSSRAELQAVARLGTPGSDIMCVAATARRLCARVHLPTPQPPRPRMAPPSRRIAVRHCD